MAHVFAIPTYRNSVANQVAKHLIQYGALEEKDMSAIMHQSGVFRSQYTAEVCEELSIEMQECHRITETEYTSPGDIEVFDPDSLLMSILKRRYPAFDRGYTTPYFIEHIIGKRQWFADYRAQCKLLSKVLSRELKVKIPAGFIVSMHNALEVAEDTTMVQAPYLNLSVDAAKSVTGYIISSIKVQLHKNSDFCQRYFFAHALECLSTEPSIMVDNFNPEVLDGYAAKDVKHRSKIIDAAVYRIDGMTVIQFAEEVFFLNKVTARQLSECVMYWANAVMYSTIGRVIGTFGTNQGNIRQALDQLIQWIVPRLNTCDESLPRDIKQSMSKMFNDIHANLEAFDLGWRARSEGFEISAQNNLYEFVTALNISDRAKIDMAHCYHGLPAPDADMVLVTKMMLEKQSDENPVDERDLDEFLAYCRTMDVVRIITKHKERALGFLYKHPSGDKVSQANIPRWARICAEGREVYPPRKDFGKYAIRSIYPSLYDINNWHLAAKDVTHVYIDRDNNEGKYEDNELLYVLKNGKSLSCSIQPDELKMIISRPDSIPYWREQCTLAAKKENTKHGAKVRETISASDTIREANTAFDFNAIPITRALPGITLRADAFEMESQFAAHAYSTTGDPMKIIISTDVSSWSPKACRRAMMRHHEYLQTMTSEPVFVKQLWHGMKVRNLKQNQNMFFRSTKGMFQGWTGTTDTIFHTHLISWAIRRLKDKNLLLDSEHATICTLIDDAIVSLTISVVRDHDSIKDLCKVFYAEMRECYKKLGMEIDETKTIVSARKCVFLNQMFLDGSELLTPMKTFCRIGKPGKRETRATPDIIDELKSQCLSAISKGTDPWSTYIYMIFRCMTLYFLKGRGLKHSRAQMILKALLPNSAGGFAIPSVASALTTCIADILSHLLCIFQRGYRSTKWLSTRSIAEECFFAVISLPYKKLEPAALISDPRTIKTTAPALPWSNLSETLRRATAEYASDDTLKCLLESSSSSAYLDAIELFMRSARVDASILEYVGKTLPHVVALEVINKFEKNLTITKILSYSGRRRAYRRFFADDRIFTKYAIPMPKTIAFDRTAEYYDCAIDIRRRFLIPSGIVIFNLTLPDPGAAIGHTLRSDVSYVEYRKPVGVSEDKACSVWGSQFESYSNMYDARSVDGLFVPRKSTNALASCVETHRMPDLISNNWAKIFVLQHAAPLIKGAMPGSIETICDFFKSAWGIREEASKLNIMPRTDAQLSTKRVDSSSMMTYYGIRAFRNTITTFRITEFTFKKYFDDLSIHLDLLSVTTLLRLCVTLDAAIMQAYPDKQYFDIPVTFKGSSSTVTCQIDSPHVFAHACELILSESDMKRVNTLKGLLSKKFTLDFLSDKVPAAQKPMEIQPTINPVLIMHHFATSSNKGSSVHSLAMMRANPVFTAFLFDLQSAGIISSTTDTPLNIISQFALNLTKPSRKFQKYAAAISHAVPEVASDAALYFYSLVSPETPMSRELCKAAYSLPASRNSSVVSGLAKTFSLDDPATDALHKAYLYISNMHMSFPDEDEYLTTRPQIEAVQHIDDDAIILDDDEVHELPEGFMTAEEQAEIAGLMTIENDEFERAMRTERFISTNDRAVVAAYLDTQGEPDRAQEYLISGTEAMQVPERFEERNADIVLLYRTELHRIDPAEGTNVDVRTPRKRKRYMQG